MCACRTPPPPPPTLPVQMYYRECDGPATMVTGKGQFGTCNFLSRIDFMIYQPIEWVKLLDISHLLRQLRECHRVCIHYLWRALPIVFSRIVYLCVGYDLWWATTDLASKYFRQPYNMPSPAQAQDGILSEQNSFLFARRQVFTRTVVFSRTYHLYIIIITLRQPCKNDQFSVSRRTVENHQSLSLLPK